MILQIDRYDTIPDKLQPVLKEVIELSLEEMDPNEKMTRQNLLKSSIVMDEGDRIKNVKNWPRRRLALRRRLLGSGPRRRPPPVRC